MKNSTFLLVIFILSMFFVTCQSKEVIEIKKEYISSGIGLLSLIAAFYNNKDEYDSQYKVNFKNDYYQNRNSSVLMAGGITASINTFLYSKNVSKKEVLIYLLSMIAIELGYLKYGKYRDKISAKKEAIRIAQIHGSLIGTGLGLLGSTVINGLASVIK